MFEILDFTEKFKFNYFKLYPSSSSTDIGSGVVNPSVSTLLIYSAP